MAAGFFVTGTDTGVGKTLVACALLERFRAAGKSAIGMKPIAAGLEDGRGLDVEALCQASGVRAPQRMVNPYAFERPIAPHIAAEQGDTKIELQKILAAFHELRELADVVIVEGAGGFLVPLTASETTADLAGLLGAPVILVVAMRLGCLNHALLTRAAVRAAGVPFAGWVANCAAEPMSELESNVRALEDRLGSPLLGRIPHKRGLSARDAAKFIDVRVLEHVHG
jgi:dethiobiotin synthetase